MTQNEPTRIIALIAKTQQILGQVPGQINFAPGISDRVTAHREFARTPRGNPVSPTALVLDTVDPVDT